MTKKLPNHQKTKQKSALNVPGDEALWGHVVSGIEPLKEHHKNRTPEVLIEPHTDGGPLKGGKRKPAGRTATAAGPETPYRSSLPELSHGAQPGLDKSTAKKLKKGQHRIEARMDLHGMTQQQAHRALNSFIDGSHGAGKRCVLVVTGKGLKPDGSVGVLRSTVPRWLNEAPNRARVLAFSYATPKDGGEGALYVMLKRKR